MLRAGYGWFFAPSSGGIGGSPGDLGSGAEAATSVFLGQPPAAPNTPPAGASLANPFVTGLISYPSTLIGSGIGAIFRDWQTPVNQMWNASLQRTIGGHLLVEVAYIGTRGEHLWANLNADAVDPVYGSLGPQSIRWCRILSLWKNRHWKPEQPDGETERPSLSLLLNTRASIVFEPLLVIPFITRLPCGRRGACQQACYSRYRIRRES